MKLTGSGDGMNMCEDGQSDLVGRRARKRWTGRNIQDQGGGREQAGVASRLTTGEGSTRYKMIDSSRIYDILSNDGDKPGGWVGRKRDELPREHGSVWVSSMMKRRTIN